MVTDSETNRIFFSSLIRAERHNKLWNNLETILVSHGYKPRFIDGTRDIWCRDYMPVQIDESSFVQFKYFPDYLIYHKYIKFLTIQEELHYKQSKLAQTKEVDLIVDGGNIVKWKDKAIMTEKVFSENKNREKKTVVEMLKRSLNVNQIFFIPVQPYDYTGHADGMVRFYDYNTLLINDYSKESASWRKKFDNAIKQTGLDVVKFPYVTCNEKVNDDYTAKGCYINYAHIGNLILFPQFGINEDGIALKKIRELYPEPQYKVEPVNSDSIAREGGVLNCITWNTYEPIISNAIDNILPIYGDKDRMFVIYSGDDDKNLIDTVCVSVSLSGQEIGDPWSLAKHLKYSHSIEPIISDADTRKAKKLLKENLTDEQLSDILNSLLHPGEEVIQELVKKPPRFTK